MRLLLANTISTATGSVEIFCWYSIPLSAVSKTSKSAAASAKSFPFLIPAQRTVEPNSRRAPPIADQDDREPIRQAGCASGARATRASSKTRTASSLLTDGKSWRNTSSGSPASRCSKSTRIGTRLPAKTGVPPRISRSTITCVDSMRVPPMRALFIVYCEKELGCFWRWRTFELRLRHVRTVAHVANELRPT